jgi:hypothetical protein
MIANAQKWAIGARWGMTDRTTQNRRSAVNARI